MLELERFVPAFTLLRDVYRKSKDVLKATGILALIIWIGGATLFYVFQPELFGSVPNAMYYTAIFLGGEWGTFFFCSVQHISLSFSLSIQHIPLSKHNLTHDTTKQVLWITTSQTKS